VSDQDNPTELVSEDKSSNPAISQDHSTQARKTLDVLGIVAVLLVILLVAYISLSDGVDYIHGFGKACLVVHQGWHFHFSCGTVSAPSG